MDFGIKGKKVLVVGASQNIGASIALAFAAEGCQVVMVARDSFKLKKILKKLDGVDNQHCYLVADLMEPGAPSRFAEEVLDRVGSLDIVVHNIGGALGYKDIFGPVEDWIRVWQFNVGIAIEMNRILAPPMKKKKWGRLIHISSISAKVGEPLVNPYGGALPYAAAKAFLNSYVTGLGRELAKWNVIVSALMPGVILSKGKYWDKLRKKDPSLVKDYLQHHYAIGRFGRAKEIAPFAVFMASEQASFAAGSIFSIDGGRI